MRVLILFGTTVSAGHNFGKYLNASNNAKGFVATDTFDKDKTFAEVTNYVDESTGWDVAVLHKEVSEDGEKDVALLDLGLANSYFMVRGDMPHDLKDVNFAHFIGYRGESETFDGFNRKIDAGTLNEWFGNVGCQSLVGVSRKLLESMYKEACGLTGSAVEQYDNLMEGYHKGVVWQDNPNSWEIKLPTPGLGGQSGSGGSVIAAPEEAKQSRKIMFVYTGSDHMNSRGTIIPKEYDDIMSSHIKK